MVRCSKCNKALKADSKFCPSCGAKVKPSTKKSEKKSEKGVSLPNMSSNSNIVLIIIAIIAILAVLAPTRTYTYNIEVPYEDTEVYYEKEPYEAEESYEVQVPYESTETYQDTVPVEVSIPYTDYEESVYHAEPGHYYPEISSQCRCTEYDFWGNCVEQTCQYAVTKYRTETQQQTVQKTRPVTKYRTEIKYRTITKYEDVEKTRTVTRTRTEQAEYEVNWLFKFRVPWRLHIP